MILELWDTSVGVGIARLGDENEMRGLVKKFLDHHSPGHENDLSIIFMDHEDAPPKELTGQTLVDWANEGERN